jgi:hypothetical protein
MKRKVVFASTKLKNSWVQVCLDKIVKLKLMYTTAHYRYSIQTLNSRCSLWGHHGLRG